MTKKQKVGCAAFFLPIALTLGMMVLRGQYPFGDNTLLIWDMDWQYVSFFSHLHDILHGDASAWYSLSRALGGDMVGIAAYYLISPFNLLFYFFDETVIYAGITLVMLLKIGSIGLTMNLFLYWRKPQLSTLIFSTAYALSSYIVGYFFNIMWLDGIMILPIMVWGIERLTEEKKHLMYVISVAYAVATNFYIGYMLCIFSVMYFFCYFFLISKKKYSMATVGRYTVASLGGGLLSACISIPTVFAIQGSKTEFDISVLKDFSRMLGMEELFTRSFVGLINEAPAKSGEALVYCGVVSLFFLLVYLLRKEIFVKEKIGNIVLVAILVCSMLFYNLYLVWHAFNLPMGSPYRFSFLYIFMVLLIANEGYCEYRKKDISSLVSGIVLLLLLVGFREVFLETPRMAVFWVNVCLVFVYTIIAVVVRKKVVRELLFLFFAGAELFVSAGYLYCNTSMFESTTVSEYKAYVDDTSYLVDKQKENESISGQVLSRTVLTGDAYRTINDSFMFNIYGLDSYTSVEKEDTHRIAFNLGFYQNMSFGIQYKNGTTQAANSLLGVKYFITSENMELGYEEVETSGDLCLYENVNALPIVMIAECDLLSVANGEFNIFAYQNAIFENFAPEIKEPIFSEVDRTVGTLYNCRENDNGSFNVNIASEEACVEYFLNIDEAGYYYLQSITSEASKVLVIINNQLLEVENQAGNAKQLGFLTPEDEVKVWCFIEPGQPRWLDKVYIYREDMMVLAQYAEVINAQEISYVCQEEDNIEVACENNEENNKVLFFTIPYEKGWNVKVDGEKAQATAVIENCIAVEIEPGVHTVQARFVPQGLYIGIAITCFTIVIMVVIYVMQGKRKKKKDE